VIRQKRQAASSSRRRMMGQIALPASAAYVAPGGAAPSQGAAVELGEHGDHPANASCPGFTRTDMTHAMVASREFTAWVESRTPLRRWADPSEVAAAAVFLASDGASYITGPSLNVDGGFVINA